MPKVLRTERVTVDADGLRGLVDDTIRRSLPSDSPAAEAMAYAVLGGGKRLRPLFLLGSAHAVGADPVPLLPAAAAVECLHAYSLIHDDLPSMDDDDIRRGRPSCHRVFGEAQAILAGDGLLTLAFGLLADPEMTPRAGAGRQLAAVATLAQAGGIRGMVKGQSLDVAERVGASDPKQVEEVQELKTGELFAAACAIGALLGGGSDAQVTSLRSFGFHFGKSFQLTDDVLDAAGLEAEVGKSLRKDERQGKGLVRLIGIDAVRALAQAQAQDALSCLSDETLRPDLLRSLVYAMAHRKV